MIHRYIIEATDEVKGFEEAIERLDREWGIEELEPCEDAISRQAVLELRKYRYNCGDTAITCVSLNSISKLPPVTSQPKAGHWNRVTDKAGHLMWECDCGWQQWFNTNYCPVCGAKMESNKNTGE